MQESDNHNVQAEAGRFMYLVGIDPMIGSSSNPLRHEAMSRDLIGVILGRNSGSDRRLVSFTAPPSRFCGVCVEALRRPYSYHRITLITWELSASKPNCPAWKLKTICCERLPATFVHEAGAEYLSSNDLRLIRSTIWHDEAPGTFVSMQLFFPAGIFISRILLRFAGSCMNDSAPKEVLVHLLRFRADMSGSQ